MCRKKPQKKNHPMPSKMISITITAHYFRKRTPAFTPQLQFWQNLPPSWHHLVLSNASWPSVLHLSFAGVSSQHLKTHAPLIVAVAAVSWFGCPSHLKSKVPIKTCGPLPQDPDIVLATLLWKELGHYVCIQPSKNRHGEVSKKVSYSIPICTWKNPPVRIPLTSESRV